jgi:hypothetical protein
VVQLSLPASFRLVGDDYKLSPSFCERAAGESCEAAGATLHQGETGTLCLICS